MFIRVDRKYTRDGQTDRSTDRHHTTALAALVHSIARQKRSHQSSWKFPNRRTTLASCNFRQTSAPCRRARVEVCRWWCSCVAYCSLTSVASLRSVLSARLRNSCACWTNCSPGSTSWPLTTPVYASNCSATATTASVGCLSHDPTTPTVPWRWDLIWLTPSS